jgi:AAHS family 3-hydroxyphenylpropionic acid transporter
MEEAGRGFLAILARGRTASTMLLWAAFALGLLTLHLLLNWLPTLLIGYGLEKHQASLAQVAFNFGGSIAALGMGRLLDGSHRRSSTAIAVSALPALLLSLGWAPNQTWAIVLIVLVLGIVMLASQAVLYAVAPECYPDVIRGAGVGAAIAAGRFGSILGPVLAGILLASGRSTSHLFLYLVPITIIGGICTLMLVWRVTQVHGAPPIRRGTRSS